MNTSIVLEPIGRISSARRDPADDDWDAVESLVVLDSARFSQESVAGLSEFSHVEIVYIFDRVDADEIQTGARHPRGRADWPKVGIFAQRGKGRPNRIGITVCRLLSIDGLKLRVKGLDAIDGSPVLDIKPVMTDFLPRGEVREPKWARELMRDYWTRK